MRNKVLRNTPTLVRQGILWRHRYWSASDCWFLNIPRWTPHHTTMKHFPWSANRRVWLDTELFWRGCVMHPSVRFCKCEVINYQNTRCYEWDKNRKNCKYLERHWDRCFCAKAFHMLLFLLRHAILWATFSKSAALTGTVYCWCSWIRAS
jgi:hypothetical protein